MFAERGSDTNEIGARTFSCALLSKPVNTRHLSVCMEQTRLVCTLLSQTLMAQDMASLQVIASRLANVQGVARDGVESGGCISYFRQVDAKHTASLL